MRTHAHLVPGKVPCPFFSRLAIFLNFIFTLVIFGLYLILLVVLNLFCSSKAIKRGLSVFVRSTWIGSKREGGKLFWEMVDLRSLARSGEMRDLVVGDVMEEARVLARSVKRGWVGLMAFMSEMSLYI